MTKISGKVEELLAKHPTLSQEEAIKIVADKNERKKQRRSEKANKGNAKRLRNESVAPNVDDGVEDQAEGESETEA
jgi:hypothetical protein